MRWQPIETAPLDGWMLLWTRHSQIPGVGRWVKHGVWGSPDGGVYFEATHWMPLPSPPEQKP